jgi:hypothetical protein
MSNERKTMTIQWLQYSTLGGLLMVLASTNGAPGASTKERVEVTSVPLAVEHIVVKSMKPYLEVKARIEKLGRFDEGMRAMLAKNDIDGPREAAERSAGPDGLAIHYVALHGDLLALRWRAPSADRLLHRQNIVGDRDDQGQSGCGPLRAATGGGLCQRAGRHDHGI